MIDQTRTSSLKINLKQLLKSIEKKTGIKPSRKIIGITLNKEVLHIRFNYPQTEETNVNPLPLKTPTFLFKEQKTNQITALEIININQALTELKENQLTTSKRE